MNAHTYTEIATTYALWVEYIDAGRVMTRDEFDSMSVEQKLALIESAFGPEQE